MLDNRWGLWSILMCHSMQDIPKDEWVDGWVMWNKIVVLVRLVPSHNIKRENYVQFKWNPTFKCHFQILISEKKRTIQKETRVFWQQFVATRQVFLELNELPHDLKDPLILRSMFDERSEKAKDMKETEDTEKERNRSWTHFSPFIPFIAVLVEIIINIRWNYLGIWFG